MSPACQSRINEGLKYYNTQKQNPAGRSLEDICKSVLMAGSTVDCESYCEDLGIQNTRSLKGRDDTDSDHHEPRPL